jgi:hypothetical protein
VDVTVEETRDTKLSTADSSLRSDWNVTVPNVNLAGSDVKVVLGLSEVLDPESF